MKKISRVKFYGHPVLGNSEINLVDKAELNNPEYISLIIGQNGTGKSQLLDAITSFLNNIYRYRDNIEIFKSDIQYGIEIDIFFNSETYTLKYNKNFSFSHDGIISISDILHDNLIVNVYTFNDKYPFVDLDNFYNYCGLRTTSNSIFVNVPIEECFLNLTSILKNNLKRSVTNDIFKELNLKRKISVNYILKSNKILNDPKFIAIKTDYLEKSLINQFQIERFKEIILSILSRGKLKNYKVQRFIDNNEEVEKVLNFLYSNEKLEKNNKLQFIWEDNIDQVELSENILFFANIDVYMILREIGLFQFDTFNVFRNEYFDFNNVSSGEFHFLSLFSSILSNIEENSLIIIDEPEISLHPNWQNKLLFTLSPIFKKYPKSQVIIASHSHLMVSSLEKSKSSLISMKNIDNQIEINNLEQLDTLGWSAEQILFDVFGMVTDRNYYLSIKIQGIIDEMSSIKPDENKIEKLKNELRGYELKNLNDKDPMKLILNKLLK
ncbi:MAG: ATP-binding protein [Flavobacteriaceae bacterium]|nr:ATP-binding protein [Flavobacteriaceae bacterium]